MKKVRGEKMTVEEMETLGGVCDRPGPCYFKLEGRCSLDFGPPCEFEVKR